METVTRKDSGVFKNWLQRFFKMNKYNTNYQSKTARYFYKISYLSFFFGMPNFWIQDLRIPKAFYHSYPYISKFCNLTFYVLIPFEIAAFGTQTNLTNKQETDRWIYCMSHPFLLMYAVVIARQAERIKEWIVHVLEISAVYSDPKLEDQMVKKSAVTSTVLVMSCIVSMALHSVSAGLQVIKSKGTFTTLITAWPSVDEVSTAADTVRIITNIVWWLFIMHAMCSYTFVISLTICMSFQYKNLQSYFLSLDGIFHEDIEQREKEEKYEAGLKTGIRLHTDTFACVNRIKKICGVVYSGQIVFVIIILVFLMLQMLKSERTMVNAVATATTSAAVLGSTGFFLWNAGDITIEASNLATVMYLSGWQHCRGQRSERIRRLLGIAMLRAQKPVVLKGLGIMDLSYQSFLYLVKTSYSVFSVLY